nr:PREDICTED: uncharacterized protein LOC106705697 [Latimeria chalumnae]|eukprot:XP_014351047.1 PREDICTED: uncharacterized protein LOC106705697 [Latimeria chalumnae]
MILPPNTTSRTQPMDQGNHPEPENSLPERTHSEAHHNCGKKKFVINVLDALQMLQHAWNKVIPTTVANCFKHSGFTAPVPTQDSQDPTLLVEEEEEEDNELPLAELMCQAAKTGVNFGGATFEDFVVMDDSVATTEPLTDNAVVKAGSSKASSSS